MTFSLLSWKVDGKKDDQAKRLIDLFQEDDLGDVVENYPWCATPGIKTIEEAIEIAARHRKNEGFNCFKLIACNDKSRKKKAKFLSLIKKIDDIDNDWRKLSHCR